ncbi:hypothetical protein A1O3_05472 [Capronia epimyces CBS 606.96]|uniref:SnoaL-like domain-containing protein n=1 Tax=Capronia epimyces CBS 606.96 TaxID=1182542 RepID=W9Y579_9EURO|nr:uncharacterized protein A1O3_05472 [Capronia epimyces CBS 606.96]EXJ84800.1 hypothetical protein A1O3_05472 [Capronia epimyces CBS 606.96]
MASAEPFHTTWPDIEAPAAVQKWLDDFYHLADNQDADAGERFAQLFTPDATMHGAAGLLVGREAIAASRPKAWIAQKHRRHEPLQVYTAKADYSEILVLGRLKSWFKNGEIVEAEFVAGITFASDSDTGTDTSTNPLCSLYRVWGPSLLYRNGNGNVQRQKLINLVQDSAPWVKAMSKKN